MAKRELIRSVVFTPYSSRPEFCLTIWDTYKTDEHGKSILAYRLSQGSETRFGFEGSAFRRNEVIFEGEDFHCSPMYAIDSDKAVGSLMGFLTLRPGDTDSEYFESYTPEQMHFAETHAEALACEVMARFGEDY